MGTDQPCCLVDFAPAPRVTGRTLTGLSAIILLCLSSRPATLRISHAIARSAASVCLRVILRTFLSTSVSSMRSRCAAYLRAGDAACLRMRAADADLRLRAFNLDGES